MRTHDLKLLYTRLDMEKTLTANFLLHLVASICSFKLIEEKRWEQKDKTEEQMKKTFKQLVSSLQFHHPKALL